MTSEEIKSTYPGKIQRKDEKRIFVMNTVFNLAETCLVAALIHHFESKDDTECRATGWVRAGKEVTFAQVFKVIIVFAFCFRYPKSYAITGYQKCYR